jgi:hypothetical protein
VVARSIRALDVAKLALEAEVDDLFNIFALEFFGIDLGILAFGAIIVDGIEQSREAAAIFDAHAAVGA